jgi:ribonuclease M5
MADLQEAGLIGTESAQAGRQAVGKTLGIGYGNAKAFLRKLNHYGISREDFAQAVSTWQAK